MIKLAVAYVSTGLTLVILDAIWLNTMGPLLYRPLLGSLLLDNVRIAPAVAFYVMFIGGIVFLGILPALGSGHWTTALLNGAVLGLLAYGAYDLTNQATLSVWDTRITLADMAWGTFVTAAASTAGYFAADWFSARR